MAGGGVHGAGQMDGRVGDPPAPRGGRRLVHHPPRRRRHRARRRRRDDVFQGQLSGSLRDRRGEPLVRRPAQPDATSDTRWTEILPRTPLEGDAHNLFAVGAAIAATHVRLRIFPDGGVARLRVYGDVAPDWDRLRRRGEVDLAAAEHGGFVVACSDMFFGSRHNLIMPGDARHMGDGWETKRRRGPGHDWTIVRLGAPGTISRVDVDTRHFKGNAPGACSLEGCVMEGAMPDLATGPGIEWRELMPRRALQPHVRHTFDDEVQAIGEVTHVRFNIFPDGGVDGCGCSESPDDQIDVQPRARRKSRRRVPFCLALTTPLRALG